MFSHMQVWTAIDALAQQNDMSVSRLARNAGLDPTTFNKSKRFTGDGRPRWPSTESLSKVMSATDTKMDELLDLVRMEQYNQSDNLSLMRKLELADHPLSNRSNSVPLIGLAQAGSGGFFDDAGLPSGNGWDDVEFPPHNAQNTYALEITGDSMLPLYRHGDRIIVSPESTIRRGDRVVVRTQDGEVMAKVLAKKTPTQIELESVNPAHENRIIQLNDLDWIARIVWASQ